MLKVLLHVLGTAPDYINLHIKRYLKKEMTGNGQDAIRDRRQDRQDYVR